MLSVRYHADMSMRTVSALMRCYELRRDVVDRGE